MPPTEIYIKLVVGFPRDQKVRALARYGAEAGLCRDLYVQMLLHCKENLTDGFLSTEDVWAVAFPLPPDHADQLAKQLASVGLIKEVSNPEAPGWQVCAFLKRNRSREEVEALSEVRAEAGRTGGKASRKSSKPAGRKPRQPTSKQVAFQVDSNLPPRVQSTEDIDASNEASDSVPTAPREPEAASVLVAEWIEHCRKRPPPQVISRVGREIAVMLGQDIDREDVRRGLAQWHQRGLDPSVLASVVNEVMNASPRTANGRASPKGPPLPASVSPRDEHRYRQ
jgi:hypothetical protein